MPVFSKLNLGAGEDIRQLPYLNIDIQHLKDIDVVANATDLFFIEDESIDFIVAQRILEYIPRKDMLLALHEWIRVLKPGGYLEIRTLDLGKLTKAMYLHDISSEMGMYDEMIISLLYGRQLNEYDIVKNRFTSLFLQGILTGCGLEISSLVFEDLEFILTARKP